MSEIAAYKFEIISADCPQEKADELLEAFVLAVEAAGLDCFATCYPVDEDGERVKTTVRKNKFTGDC